MRCNFGHVTPRNPAPTKLSCYTLCPPPRSSCPIQRFSPPPLYFLVRCRANMAQIRQSRPELVLVFQAKDFEIFQNVASSLGLDSVHCFPASLGSGGVVKQESASPPKIKSRAQLTPPHSPLHAQPQPPLPRIRPLPQIL
jgi:hypothetical protein